MSKVTGRVLSGLAGAAVSTRRRRIRFHFGPINTPCPLTFADILVVLSSGLSLVDQRTLAVQVGGGAIGQRLVVQMVQTAVVQGTLRLAQVQEGAAQELRLDLTGQATSLLRAHLHLLVRVVVQADVLRDLVLGHSDTGHLERTRVLARLLWLQAEILKVIGAGGVHQLHELSTGSAVGVAQHALHVVVIVLDGPAGEALLVQTGRQTGLLGAGVDEGVVQAADDLVGHTLERPGTHADVLAAQVQLDHVVHAGRPLGHGTGIVSVRVILQLAECLLGGGERVHHEAREEKGR